VFWGGKCGINNTLLAPAGANRFRVATSRLPRSEGPRNGGTLRA
jgi:hypothetical protein